MQNPLHILKRNKDGINEYGIKDREMIEPLDKLLSPLYRASLKNFEGIETSQGFNDLGIVEKTAQYEVKCNSLGFRSDEFKSDHSKGLHIVFAGCSETFGEGGPLEESWAHKTYTAVDRINKTTGYFNIGFPGKGYQDIINLSLQYIDSYGSPDYLIMAFPSILRKVAWVNKVDLDVDSDFNYNKFIEGHYILMPRRDNKSRGEIRGNYQLAGNGMKVNYRFSESTINTEYANFYLAMNMLVRICKEKNIKLLWTTIDLSSKIINKKFKEDFKDSFIPTLASEGETLEYMASHPGTTYEKPDGHGGSAAHSIWSEKMVARIFNSINNGDINAKE